MHQQTPTVPGILRDHPVGGTQNLDRPQGNVIAIAERSRYDIQAARCTAGYFFFWFSISQNYPDFVSLKFSELH
jgi:hypothetical protein